MKAEDLLLTPEQVTEAWLASSDESWRSVCRAQAAKVLAVLVEHSGDAQAENIERWVRETGLTWPPKEG